MIAKRYRKKPVVIEAVEWDGSREREEQIVSWAKDTTYAADGSGALEIRTLEGTMRANVGDWIVRGVKGEFYAVRPDIFEATYEPA